MTITSILGVTDRGASASLGRSEDAELFERFLAGDSAKEAARHLGLSRHTVVQYAKDIYRTLGVSTRAELMLVLMRGTRPPGA